MRFLATLALAAIPLFSQSNTPVPRSAVSDDILFSFYFRHLSASEAAATAASNGDSPMKQDLKIRAGFTDTEFSLVREVALGCSDAYEAKTRSGGAEIGELAAQYPQTDRSRQAAPPAVAARIDALERERAKVITDCVDNLKRGLGEARFALFHRYVRAQGAGIRYVDPASPEVKRVPAPAFIPSGGAGPGGVK